MFTNLYYRTRPRLRRLTSQPGTGMMSSLPEEPREKALRRVKGLLEAALIILDRNQDWAIGAPISSVIAMIDGILDDEDTVH
jgi:hypothetical protein